MVVLVAVLAGVSSDQRGAPAVPIGRGGELVTDSFFFVHQPMTGDGGITVSVSALDVGIAPDLEPGTVPWAKAGLVIKDGTRPGSAYAAIMVTSGHGVRMQHDYTEDTAGLPGPVSTASPRWLRLERSGDAITGYDSTDGLRWTAVGTVHLDGLGPTAQAGLFVASPDAVQGPGTVPSVATAVFADLRTEGGRLTDHWTGDRVGPEPTGHPPTTSGSVAESDGRLTVTGTGDIAPAVRASLGTAGTIADVLTGTFPALITVIVLGTLFITTEYRDLIHVTLAASAGRSRVLAAKAIVLGGVTFTAGLAGTAIAIPLGEHLARQSGVHLFPITPSTQLRVVLGTAALLATAAVLALAVGTLFRRSAGAVTTVTIAVVLPYLLVAQIPFIPDVVTDWLTRVTPAAAFAVQQSVVPYHQVTSVYTPYNGYYPLAPWAGFAVLAGYAVVSLAAAAVVLRRRDA
ncbi:MAG: ABC transporter permease subunit [Saccharothrix sp.]|nr:ABC transporter permease subunit [Saccharothrix sp.]